MHLKLATAQIFVPDELPAEQALARTTHMAIAAHQDDIEIMAIDGILACFQREDQWFTGVVVTNGSGSPRDDLYRDYTNEQMWAVRVVEQKKAAYVGEYAAQALLDYPSAAVKDSRNPDPVDDIANLLKLAQPKIVYVHNLADKHETHVATALRTIQAIRQLPAELRPGRLYGCEVWRNLDWMVDSDKIAFDCSGHEALQSALVGVFDSQISGGKRYDLATMGRRRANATYHASHGTDTSSGLVFAMDLTPLVQDTSLSPKDYVQGFLERFVTDVAGRMARFE